MSNILIDPRNVALLLGVSLTTVKRLYTSGKLPFVRIGRQVRIKQTSLDVFIEKQRNRGEGRAA
jgi:excisionase family DNA binding protein